MFTSRTSCNLPAVTAENWFNTRLMYGTFSQVKRVLLHALCAWKLISQLLNCVTARKTESSSKLILTIKKTRHLQVLICFGTSNLWFVLFCLAEVTLPAVCLLIDYLLSCCVALGSQNQWDNLIFYTSMMNNVTLHNTQPIGIQAQEY